MTGQIDGFLPGAGLILMNGEQRGLRSVSEC